MWDLCVGFWFGTSLFVAFEQALFVVVDQGQFEKWAFLESLAGAKCFCSALFVAFEQG
jgi:hypothetical protein